MFLMRSSVSRQIVDDCVEKGLLEIAKVGEDDNEPIDRENFYATLLCELVEQARKEGIRVQCDYYGDITEDNLSTTRFCECTAKLDGEYCGECGKHINDLGW